MERPRLKPGLKRDLRTRIAEYSKILRIDAIARRYIVMNAFDGVLTMFGIIASAWAANIADARLLIVAGLGAALAVAVSGFWGAYLTEVAERKKDLRELERQMLTGLRGTKIGTAARIAPLIIAAINGLTPFIAALIMIAPFLVLPIAQAYAATIVGGLVLLFSLGIFLGTISREHLLLSGLKMLSAGLVAIALVWLIGQTIPR